MTRELTFNPTTFTVLTSILAMASIFTVAFLAWRRSGYHRGTGLLESLRVVLVLLALVTLLQPEFREAVQPQDRPVLSVLWDASTSMDTRDVVSDHDAQGVAMTRRQWLSPQLHAPFWDQLKQKVNVVFEPFSATDSEGTDINAALEDTLARHENLRAVVLISDGDWNLGQTPVHAATRLRSKQVRVFPVGLGSEIALPDVEVAALDAPTFSVAGKSLQIPFLLRSTLPREAQVQAKLAIDNSTGPTKQILIPALGEVRDVITWKPDRVGKFSLTLSVPVQKHEAIHDNNSKTVSVAIRAESLNVLVIESIPRWEYRYLRNALERDPGVELSCLLFHPGLSNSGGGSGYIGRFPETNEALARYDVVLIGDVGATMGELTPQQCSMLKGLVEQQASGLVFMPGMRGRQRTLLTTDLKDLYPVVLDAAHPSGFGTQTTSSFVLTKAGRRSLLTKLADDDAENDAVWRGLPGFQWRSPAIRSKAGTEVLALHESSRAPLLVTKTFGNGKILFMGTDSAWRWRAGVEDKYHYRFWGQVARWMAYQRHMAEGELLRLFYSPDRPHPGHTVTLNANVLDPNGSPFSDGTLTADIVEPSGGTQRIRFQSSGTQWGLYTARFTPDQPGDFRITLTCSETSAELESTISIQGQKRERVGKPARLDVLREIADLSRGKLISPERISSIRELILELPEPEASIRRRQLWASPYWAGMLIGLLCVFWVGRKLNGSI